jgi:hypothetical protein
MAAGSVMEAGEHGREGPIPQERDDRAVVEAVLTASRTLVALAELRKGLIQRGRSLADRRQVWV